VVDNQNSVRQGILLMVLGTSIVPVMDAIAKFLGDTMSPIQITWGRFFFQFIIMAVAMLLLHGPRPPIPAKPKTHALRGFLFASAPMRSRLHLYCH